jgi:hypothetical protein
MGFRNFLIDPNDRPLDRYTTSNLSMPGWFSGGWGGMSTWFRLLGLGIGLTSPTRSGPSFLGFRRWQPIPVVVTTWSPAPHPQPTRGKVVRI